MFLIGKIMVFAAAMFAISERPHVNFIESGVID
jgi:hypothetical protein